MESIYYVLCWQCHRQCVHCYEERFRPYYGEELDAIVDQSRELAPRIIANFPERMTFLDPADELPDGRFREKRGRVILAGGEVLHKAVREPVLYPAIRLLREKYRGHGGVDIIVQTTGDLVTEAIVGELLQAGADKISVSGLDDYHEGIEPEALRAKLVTMFEAHGMQPDSGHGPLPADAPRRPPSYSFFGATPGSWIGALWPRGRAHRNELSTATLSENFCNRWSGGLNFLQHQFAGSEVSVDPDGNVYPCCIKTRKELGNLTREPLHAMLDRLTGNPVYEAISMGHPERMGLAHGWSVEKFLAKSATTLPSGKPYRNLCIGCDAFHNEVFAPAALVNLSGRPD